MQISGLVLDVYDDFNGGVLRSIFSTPESIPDLVKQAEALEPTARAKLPDNVYALVLQNGDQQLRKFACTDPGNVVLSVLYFTKNAHKLPLEAQKVAAENLTTACSWYGLDGLAKEAGLVDWGLKKAVGHAASNPVSTLMTAATVPALAKGTSQEIGGRMGAIRQFEGNGGGVATPHEVGHMMGKKAEATGTALMPIAGPDNKSPTPALATVRKTGSVMNPHVDVTDRSPPQETHEKQAMYTACPESYPGRYPLDTFEQVKCASAYFEEYGALFAPSERREFCQNLVKRASALEIEVSKTARKYGSDVFAPMVEIKIAMDSRRSHITDEVSFAVLEAMEEKIASTPADLFCATLGEFDKANGLDQHYDKGVLDPFFSTYGSSVKVAEDKDTWSWIDGNAYLTYADLRTVIKTRVPSLLQTFGKDFVKEFRTDPIGIFSSLPRDQKRMLAAMAVDNAPGSNTSY